MPSIFDIPPEKLRRWRIGEPVDANKLNQPVEVLNKMLRGVRPARQISPKPVSAPAAIEVRKFKVRALLVFRPADVIACTDVESGIDLPVAYPWTFRESVYTALSRPGITYTRLADQRRLAHFSETEIQQILPYYFIGDIIYVVKPFKGTGVILNVGEENESPVEWLDLNVDGRVWAKER